MEKIDLINKSAVFTIDEASKVFLAKKEIEAYLSAYRFPNNFISDTLIIVSELATNLLKHSKSSGLLIFRLLEWPSGQLCGYELLSCDTSEPLTNFSEVLQDGYSTAGTLGTGLGGIKRLSDEFLHFGSSDLGNAFIVRKFRENVSLPKFYRENLNWICTPQKGYQHSGDAVACVGTPHGYQLLLADGLGHGEPAAQASAVAKTMFYQYAGMPISEQLTAIHKGMAGTRGAVLALADINLKTSKLCYLGIGNIAARAYLPEKAHGLISMPGIVGANLRKQYLLEHDFPPGSVLVMHSDGLKNIGLLKLNFRGKLLRHPALALAAGLFAKLYRNTDDAALLVYKNIPSTRVALQHT